jgi:hypothetical protein
VELESKRVQMREQLLEQVENAQARAETALKRAEHVRERGREYDYCWVYVYTNALLCMCLYVSVYVLLVFVCFEFFAWYSNCFFPPRLTSLDGQKVATNWYTRESVVYLYSIQ